MACMSLTAAAILLIAMGELNRLSADVLDKKARAWPFQQLMGPGRLFDASPAGWIAGTGASGIDLSPWLRWYLILDLAFLVLYTVALFAWFRPRCPSAARVVLVLGFADLVEDVLGLIAGRPAMDTSQANLAQSALPFASMIKWWLVVGLVACLFIRFLVVPQRTEPDSAPQQKAPLLWLSASAARLRPRSFPPTATAWPAGFDGRYEDWRPKAKALARAAFVQRFPVLPLIPLLFLGLVPGPDMADQLPDVQRHWFDGGFGFSHAGLAALSLLLLAVAMFALGRLRSDFAYWLTLIWNRETATTGAQTGSESFPPESSGTDTEWVRPRPTLWVWAAGPAFVIVLAVIVTWPAQTRGLIVWRLAIFIGVPLGVFFSSWCLRAIAEQPDYHASGLRRCIHDRVHSSREASEWFRNNLHPPSTANIKDRHLPVIELFGDTIATLTLAIGGLGLVRSFTAVAALRPQELRGWVLVLIGALAAVLAWPLAWMVMWPQLPGWIGRTMTPGATIPTAKVARNIRVGMLATSTLGFLLAGVTVLWLAQWAGVVASVILALTMLTGMVGSLVVLTQNGRAPHLFQLPLIRLRAAPIVSLLMLTVLWASSTGGQSDVHGVRALVGKGTSSAPPPDRRDLSKAFADWVEDENGCRTTEISIGAGKDVTLRPFVMVAAEGGGIRAAYWAAAGMQLLSGYTLSDDARLWRPPSAKLQCGSSSIFFASGASGGSVGLTVARLTKTDASPADTPRDQVVAMAGPEALGAAVIGLLVRDPVYSATGVPLPVFFGDIATRPTGPDGTHAWVDRSALMEYAWEHASSSMRAPFLQTATNTPNGLPPWHLVFGSTSMTTGCRQLVSELALPPSHEVATSPIEVSTGKNADDKDAPADGTCTALSRPAAQSADLLGDYRRRGDQKGCFGDLTASTAAMLSARFPYVTPSGVIGPCGRQPTQQLVDAGYTENTGIGTIVDLSPRWLPLIEAHNTRELTKTSGVSQLIVPLVVYLDNGTGSDVSSPTRNITSELLVPPVGSSRAGFAQADTPALLQRAASLTATDRLWAPDVPDSEQLAAAITRWRPRPVVVVNQSTSPAITAPLGWVLSQDSVSTMDKALKEQSELRCRPNAEGASALCRNGIGTLWDAREILKWVNDERP